MLTHVTEVTIDTLVDMVASRFPQGYRFVTVSCTDLGDAHDLLYHFDKDYELSHLRLRLPRGQALPSISGIYVCAAGVENELQDLFGVQVKGLALNYEGKLLLSEGAPLAPFNKSPAADAIGAAEPPAACPSGTCAEAASPEVVQLNVIQPAQPEAGPNAS